MPERSLTIKINLNGNVDDQLVKMDKDVKRAIEDFKSFEGNATRAMDHLAKTMGMSRSEVEKLSKQVKDDFRLKDEMKLAAKAAGITDGELKAMNKTLKENERNSKSLSNVMQGIAGLEIAGALKGFAAESLHAGIEAQKTEAILRNLSGDGFDKVSESIDKMVVAGNGIATGGELQAAANQALSFGASLDFVSNNMGGLTMLAETTGGNISQMMEKAQVAIQSGRVGFLKENAMFSKYVEDFKKIGTGFDEVTQKKRELFLTKILSENDIQIQKQFSEYIESGPAQFKTYNQNVGEVKEGVGKLLLDGITPLLKIANKFMHFFLDGEAGASRLKIITLILAPILGSVFVASLLATASAALTAAAGVEIFGHSLSTVMKNALMIIGAFVALYLIVEDLWVFSQGGESLFGDFLQWLGFSPEDIQAVQAVLKDFFDGLSAIGESVIPFLQKYGKQILAVVIPIGLLILTFMFPFVMIPALLLVATAFIVKYWKDIKNFFINGFNALIDIALFIGKVLIMYLFPFSMIYFFWDEIMAFFQSIPDKIISIFSSMKEKIKEILRDMLPESLIRGLKAIGIDLSGPEIDGARADGGPVEMGKSYLVGERGPEIFKPRVSGSIDPNSSLGNSGSGPVISLSFGNIIISGNSGEEAGENFISYLRAAMPGLSRELAAKLGVPA